ncbi:MAG TPA: Dyp-type peroxidase [Amaricoccus sp.]|jgi:putative iron-dependent peroxidase|nr:Dyp-type peroxidase [Amaricoccus sp.]
MSASQPATGALTSNAVFITLTVAEGAASLATVRGFCGDLGSLVKAVGFRNAAAGLSCAMGIGDALWRRLSPDVVPRGLHPFREVAGVHHAPATPGDILFHIRASRPDFCFELATHIMDRLRLVTTVEDETQGFKFFDNRDLLGFVDGTENPVGAALVEAVVIGDEDPGFAGGAYVIVQKYLHDMATWEAMSVEQQERVLGRHKLSDIEFPDAEKASYAHNLLTNIEDADGRQLEILRDNMPFGSPARGEFGTYFIGYAREPGRIETMLDNMFIGDPPGNYDRLLDVSRAVTGGLFFVPTAEMLDRIAASEAPAEPVPAMAGPEPAPRRDGSLGVGSLKQGG